MEQPKEWLEVSFGVLFMLTVSFAKAMIEPDGGLLDSMVFVYEREDYERHGYSKRTM